MKPPILVFSDTHFHNWKSHATIVDGVNSRLSDTLKACIQAFEIGKAHGCKLALFGGDMFHVRGTLKPSVMNQAVSLFLRYGSEMDILMVPGNHDMENFRYGDTAVDIFSVVEGCSVASTPFSFNVHGWSVGCLPYIHDSEEFKKEFKELAADKPDVFLVHQGIDNFKTEPGMPDLGVTAQWLKDNADGAWVLAGHYHAAQQNERVISIGAPLQQNFGEEEKTGCWVVYEDRAEHFPLAGPRFVTIEADDLKALKKQESEIKGNFVRVRTNKASLAEKLRERIEEVGGASATILVEHEFEKAHAESITITTPRKMLCEFVEKVEPYKKDGERLIALFDKISP